MCIRDAKSDSVKRKMGLAGTIWFTAEGPEGGIRRLRRLTVGEGDRIVISTRICPKESARTVNEKQSPRYARDDTRFLFDSDYNGMA